MKILVDENIPNITIWQLQKMGHDVKDVRGTDNEGITDEYLREIAQREQRLLISTDKGFTQHRNHPHYGIIIILLKKPNKDKIHQRVINVVNQFREIEWPNMIVVVKDTVQSVWRGEVG